jgi:aarF domain-containing kinase
MFRRLLRHPLTSLVPISGILVFSLDPPRRSHVVNASQGVVRFIGASYAAVRVKLDYDASVKRVAASNDGNSEAMRDAQRAFDKRSAERLLAFARSHGGVYAKFAQYLSTMNHALSPDWTETLAQMLNDAKPCPWADVAAVFEGDFGVPASSVFSTIDEIPVAAASMAQVHRAVLRDTGETVAVKIQYPGLWHRAHGDMATLRFLASVYGAYNPDSDYEWLFPEFFQSMAAELNFLQEARNSERAAAMLAHDARFAVPRVLPHLCSERVLVMEWITGVTLHEATIGPAALGARAACGADADWVASAVLDAFAELTFVHGFVHCDPHAANLMLRKGKGPELVILDWGMVRRLSPSFRRAYAELWRALLARDHAAGLQAVRALGLRDDEYDALSLMLTYRPAEGSTALGARIDADERARMKDKYKNVKAADLNDFLQRLPRDLLFVGRNAQIVRSINLSLGGSSRDRFRANGSAAIRGISLTKALGGFSSAGAMQAARGSAASVVADFAVAPQQLERGIVPLAAAAVRAALGFQHEAPRAPVSYLTALRAASAHEAPTESEDLAAARGAPLTTLQRVVSTLDSAALFWRLWAAETLLGLATWWSGHAAAPEPATATASKMETSQMG